MENLPSIGQVCCQAERNLCNIPQTLVRHLQPNGQNCNSHVMVGGDPIGVSAGATMGGTSFLEVDSGFTKCIILSVQEAPSPDAGPAHSDVTAAKDGND
jgi:hypothetical protein